VGEVGFAGRNLKLPGGMARRKLKNISAHKGMKCCPAICKRRLIKPDILFMQKAGKLWVEATWNQTAAETGVMGQTAAVSQADCGTVRFWSQPTTSAQPVRPAVTYCIIGIDSHVPRVYSYTAAVGWTKNRVGKRSQIDDLQVEYTPQFFFQTLAESHGVFGTVQPVINLSLCN
jgi:hypothetical protein